MHAELPSAPKKVPFTAQPAGKKRVVSPWTEARDLLLVCDHPRGVPLADLVKRLNALPGVPLASKQSITTHARQTLGLHRPLPAPTVKPVDAENEPDTHFEIVTAADTLKWGVARGLDPNRLDLGAVNRKRIQAGERQWIIGAPGIVERLAR